MREHKIYLYSVLAVIVVVTLLASAINTIVDPYGVHRLVEIEGFNKLKPSAQTNLRLVKAHDLTRVKPDAIFMGNSRVDQGFNPHLASVRFNRNVYNAGLPGSSIYEIYRYLQHAKAAGPLDRVVLALDVFSFNTNTNRVATSFSEGRLDVDAENESTPIWDIERFRDLHHIYAAWPTLMKSLTTIVDQEEGWASTRTALGYNPMIEGDYFIAKTGYWRSFEKKNENYVRRLRRRQMNFAPTKKWPDGSMVYFEKIVAFCRENDIHLDLLIHPYHAHVLEIMRETGIWPIFQAWKRELVATLASDRARHPDKAEFALWDFSGYNTVTTESPPAPDAKQEMKWYWESSHYKEIVGTAMAIRMYNLDRQDLVPEDFGARLTTANIEAHMKAMDGQSADYRRRHPDEIAALEKLYRAYP